MLLHRRLLLRLRLLPLNVLRERRSPAEVGVETRQPVLLSGLHTAGSRYWLLLGCLRLPLLLGGLLSLLLLPPLLHRHGRRHSWGCFSLLLLRGGQGRCHHYGPSASLLLLLHC